MSDLHNFHFQGFADTFAIEYNVTDDVVKSAKDLMVLSKCDVPSEDEIEAGSQRLQAVGKKNMDHYRGLVEKLCAVVEDTSSLHWRHFNLSVAMLSILCRHDTPLPVRAVQLMVDGLNHDNVLVRKCSIHVVGCILKQQKRAHPKVEAQVDHDGANIPGDRQDNLWMCYDPAKVPKNQSEWDEKRFVHKTHYGYYKWPKMMKVYAPSQEQPRLNRPLGDLDESEAIVYSFFSSEAKVDKLIGFLSLEEHKGFDRFDARRFCMFKGLFRNFGDDILKVFRPHLERLVDEDNESSHRCAAEIIAGLIRGSKHWSYDMTASLWEWLTPLLRKVMSKITVESFSDWGTCFATASESRDPNR